MGLLRFIRNLFSRWKEVDELPSWVQKEFSKKKKKHKKSEYRFKGKHHRYKILIDKTGKTKFYCRKRVWVRSGWVSTRHIPKWARRAISHTLATTPSPPFPGTQTIKIKGRRFKYKYVHTVHLWPAREWFYKKRKAYKD